MAAKRLQSLDRPERAVVMEEVRFWHQRKWFVHAVSVMPSHVHVLAEPLSSGPDTWYSLSEILHSVKRRSARRVNKGRARRGSLWESERYDRLIRNDDEFARTLDYHLENAAEQAQDGDPYSYDGFWCPGLETVLPGERIACPPSSGVGQPVHADEFVRRRRHLPHWEAPASAYHIVFRLKGHRPAEKDDWAVPPRRGPSVGPAPRPERPHRQAHR
jgi:putative transposase